LGPDWDWQLSVTVYRGKLREVVAGLFVMLGMVEGRVPETVLRRVRLAVLEILRPAESALRRVIVMAALGIVVAASKGRKESGKRSAAGKSHSAPERAAVFALFDPRIWLGGLRRSRKGRRGPGPRITEIGVDRYVAYVPPPLPLPDDDVDAASLVRRLKAMRDALDDIPGQAQRLARLIARRRARARPGIVRPMRYARPPGYRARGKRPVDVILAECQYLALLAMDEAERAAA